MNHRMMVTGRKTAQDAPGRFGGCPDTGNTPSHFFKAFPAFFKTVWQAGSTPKTGGEVLL